MYMDSYEDFTGDRLHYIMLGTGKAYYPVNTKENIAKLAKVFFGVDNYELPVGTYQTARWGTVNVLRIGDLYLRVDDADHYAEEGAPGSTFSIKSFEKNGSELVVVSELVDRVFSGNDQPDEITHIYGTQTMYLEYTKNGLKIKKVRYVSNE